MATNTKKVKGLQIPFKEFMPGQLIISSQFNDDMKDIEDKVNEIIEEHNVMSEEIDTHTDNTENPHQVNAHQVGTYDSGEIDEFVNDLRNGEFNDNVIENNVLADDCIDTRNYRDASITSSKVEPSFGSQLDISENIEIKTRYTKQETDELIKTKVGDGTYTKEELDTKFEEVQAGVIIDSTIGLEKLKPNVGNELDISRNVNIRNKYTKDEVDYLIKTNALPRDWGSILEADIDESFQSKDTGVIPAADYMIADMFVSPTSTALEFDIKEVADSRNGYDSLNDRLNASDTKISSLELSVNDFKSEVETAFLNTLEKVDTLEEISGSLDTQIKGINKQIFDNTNEVDSKIKKINTQLKQVDTSINNANTQISALTEKDANHEANLNKLGSRIDTTSSQLEQVKSDVETLKNKPSVPVEIVQQVNKNTEDNKRQDIMLSGLFNENADGRLSTEESGNDIKLIGSKQGLVEIEKVVGNTLVNIKQGSLQGSCISYIDGVFSTNFASNRVCVYSKTIKPNTRYFIFSLTSLVCTANYHEGTSSGMVSKPITDLGYGVYSLTTSNTCEALGVNFKYSDDSKIDRSTEKILILEGNYTNKPIPREYFEGLQSTFEDKLITQEMVDTGEELAENLGKYKVGAKVVGKNKIDFKNIKVLNTNSSTHEVINGGLRIKYSGVNTSTSKSYTYIRSELYEINPDVKRLILSYKHNSNKNQKPRILVKLFDSKTSSTSIKDYSVTGFTNMEIPQNAKYYQLVIYSCNGEAGIVKGDYVDYIDVQLEEVLDSSINTTQYEPYKECITNVYLNSPLAKGDEIVAKEDGLYHYHKMKKVVLDNNSKLSMPNSVYQPTNTNYIIFGYEDNTIKTNVNCHCDRFNVLPSSTVSKNLASEGVWVHSTTNSIRICVLKSKLTPVDVSGFNKWLQDNPITIIYELTKPYYEKISDDKFISRISSGATLHIENKIPHQSVTVNYTGGMFKTQDRLDNIDMQIKKINNNYPIVSVKDFGAIGDGITDDTQAIQEAINYVSNYEWKGTQELTYNSIKGGTVIIPQGKYRITSTIYLAPHTEIQGQNTSVGYNFHNGSMDYTNNGTVLVCDMNDANSFVLDASPYDKLGKRRSDINDIIKGPETSLYDRVEGITIKGIMIYNNHNKKEVFGGINVKSAPCCNIIDTAIIGTNIGIYLQSTWCTNIIRTATFSLNYGIYGHRDVNRVSISKCYIDHVGGHISSGQPLTYYTPNDIHSLYPEEGNGIMPANYVSISTGIYLLNCLHVSISDCSIQYWDRGVFTSFSCVSIDNCWFELIHIVDIHRIHGSVIMNNCRKETSYSKHIRCVGGAGAMVVNGLAGSDNTGSGLSDFNSLIDYKQNDSTLIINSINFDSDMEGISPFKSFGLSTYSSNSQIRTVYYSIEYHKHVREGEEYTIPYPKGFDKYNTVVLGISLQLHNGNFALYKGSALTNEGIVIYPEFTNEDTTMQINLLKQI